MLKMPSLFSRITFPALFCLLFFHVPLTLRAIAHDLNAQQSILLDLKQKLGYPPSLQSWNSSSSPCDWPEITCTGNTVTGISLSSKNITKKIPARVCDINSLTILNLSYNFIPGEFPDILNCSKLEHLDLSQNYFVGPIPDDIDRFSLLQYLDLTANNFSGDVPAAIGRLPQLRYLFLVQNEFNGTWPVEIGNLSKLEVLAIAYNDKFVPSTIPKELGALKKLKYLWMTEANLIGEIPESFNNLSSLEHLDLCVNELNGTIPGGMLMLKNLSILYLYDNTLSGHIPSSVGALNLKEIDLSHNRMTGPIPEDFGKLQNLTTLNLFWNQFSGEIPANIALIRSLENFKAFGNQLSGDFPSELGLHSKLLRLEVCDNQLSGELPQHLCAGGSLLGLVASNNKLSGEVPKSVGNCSSLRTIQLANNGFSGDIPSGIWTFPNMTTVLLSENSFSGKLPSKLGRNLFLMNISYNKFSGPIPAEISSWMNIGSFIASNNMFSGKIPVELTSLTNLSVLLLDGNQFFGDLPTKIISWKRLTTLNLSNNSFSGQIPKALGSLPSLNYLDLSGNQFSGQIPSELGHLRLNILNLSSNQLSGNIPLEFQNKAYEDSFFNNSKLCAGLPILKLPTCDPTGIGSDKLSTKYLVMTIVFTTTGFLVVVFSILFMVQAYWRRKTWIEGSYWTLISFHKRGFEISEILPSLTKSNLIGTGGSGEVYRISTSGHNQPLAVKRMWNNRKLRKEFVSEVETLGTIRHSNIVKLLCCIASENSWLLVYEYMEKQSLDRWLHGKKRKTPSTTSSVLDWPTRLRIAVGAAQGLCHLHQGCSPPIIHRDVKSSNILLDSEFNAKIADFGLAKMLNKHGMPVTMSTFAGTFGYIAPECGQSRKVNEKVDVYSFGVVLLELVTGRESNSGKMGLAEWAWRDGREKPSMEVVDEEIKEQCNLKQVSTVFNLGLKCTSTKPSDRPSMKEVLEFLRKCDNQDGHGGNKGRVEDAASLLVNGSRLGSYKHGDDEDNIA